MKRILKPLLESLKRVTLFWVILQSKPVRYVLLEKLGWRKLYIVSAFRPHPYDIRNGTDTGGMLEPQDFLKEAAGQKNHAYWGAPPSVLRTMLLKLAPLERFAFIDLGCGKGRPLFVASEFPFREILGVDLSPSLVDSARANAAIIAAKYPGRTTICTAVGDAGAFEIPAGDLLIFLYHPFGADVMQKVLAHIEAALAAEKRTICIIYQNPVVGHVFDASPAFHRFFAGNIPCTWEERGFRFGVTDTIIIWHSDPAVKALPGAEAKIVETIPKLRAEVAV